MARRTRAGYALIFAAGIRAGSIRCKRPVSDCIFKTCLYTQTIAEAARLIEGLPAGGGDGSRCDPSMSVRLWMRSLLTACLLLGGHFCAGFTTSLTALSGRAVH